EAEAVAAGARRRRPGGRPPRSALCWAARMAKRGPSPRPPFPRPATTAPPTVPRRRISGWLLAAALVAGAAAALAVGALLHGRGSAAGASPSVASSLPTIHELPEADPEGAV